MNVNLAPVLDVYRQAGDFDDQFGRSYSKNPTVVSDLGASMITARQAGGVAAAAKHFPGLGAASARQNTDVRPVTLNLPLATIRRVDEVAVPGRDQCRSQADHAVVGYLPGDRSTARPGSRPTWSRVSCGTGSSSPGSPSPTPWRPARCAPTARPRTVPCSPRRPAWTCCSAAAQNVTQGEQASGELAAAYRKGKLNGPAFLASVNRVVTLRQSVK